ncbi:MAG: cupredoxin domain-containing protein [Deltaproteobacteria bacterium]|nr:cupredoxin domain-containing protein [Deltaproteobacteria bacterium]
MLDIDLGTILFGGAIAGFTIYLGLPIVFLRVSDRLRLFLSAASVGILLYLFVEISYHVIEQIESAMKLTILGYRSVSDVVSLVLIFVAGFALSLLSLLGFEAFVIRQNGGQPKSPTHLALMIAVGIGLHNFSEGLVIGQQFASGALSLGYLLVIGFALHNATEGFGIAGPLSNHRPSVLFVILLGLIGGGPTFLGTFVGSQWTSEPVETLFLSLAAGAILYIVGELIHLGKLKGAHMTATMGLLVGFFLAFGSDLVIEGATTVGFLKEADQKEIQMHAGDYFFEPREIHLKTGEATKILIENRGEVEHEIEILGMGEEIEQVIPWQGKGVVLLYPRHAGRYPFICDMPGHLAQGMRGTLVVE